MPRYDDSELDRYYEMLGLTQPMIDQVKTSMAQMIKFVGNAPEYVFIENTKNSEGNREAVTLALFTKDTVSEVTLSGAQRYYHYIIRRNGISVYDGIGITEMSDMDMENVNEQSQLTVAFTRGTETAGNYSAVGRNCKELIFVIKEFMFPNV